LDVCPHRLPFFISLDGENHRDRTLSIAVRQVNKDHAQHRPGFQDDVAAVGMTTAAAASRAALLDFMQGALILALSQR
jgi:hypothetical protein